MQMRKLAQNSNELKKGMDISVRLLKGGSIIGTIHRVVRKENGIVFSMVLNIGGGIVKTIRATKIESVCITRNAKKKKVSKKKRSAKSINDRIASDKKVHRVELKSANDELRTAAKECKHALSVLKKASSVYIKAQRLDKALRKPLNNSVDNAIDTIRSALSLFKASELKPTE